MTNSAPKLASQQRQLYEILQRSGDVAFVDLYLALGGRPERAAETDGRGRHYAQSWLGPRIVKLNKRLKPHGQRVVPGRIKRTYCLAAHVD